MRIECPDCNSSYEIPRDSLPQVERGDRPQKMRCYKCSTVFIVSLRDIPLSPGDYEDLSVPKIKSSPEKKSPPPAPKKRPEKKEHLFIEAYNSQAVRSETSERLSRSGASGGASSVVAATSNWNNYNTLDLQAYAIANNRKKSSIVPMVMVMYLVCMIVFFVFVSYRNGWTLSFKDLPRQVFVAFSPDAVETIDPVRALDVTLNEGVKILVEEDDRQILIARGKITNKSDEALSNVLIKVAVVDVVGNERYSVVGPCGRFFKTRKLKKMKKERLANLYTKKGKTFNCRLAPSKAKKYQLVIGDLPIAFKEQYTLQVTPVAAKIVAAEKESEL